MDPLVPVHKGILRYAEEALCQRDAAARSKEMPLRIVIADDHEVVRQGVRAVLEAQPGWRVTAEAETGRSAVEVVLQHRPDVAVMDITMPGLNGLEATRQILRVAPELQILILSLHDSEQLVREVLASGARGYLLKSDASRDLVTAVDALSRRQTFFSSRISEVVLRGYLKGVSLFAGTETPEAGQLTPREAEIVRLLTIGNSNKQVAYQLQISAKTVETHRRRIMDKLQLGSIADLVRYAIRHRMIET
jgi:DNA-binding NarL/FixJ family response regulator